MIYKNINRLNNRNRTEKAAVAIRYDENGDGAPIVTASGKGIIAKKIIEMAKEKNIPIEEDMNLVVELLDMDLGEMIPPQLYSVIAEILLLIERMEDRV